MAGPHGGTPGPVRTAPGAAFSTLPPAEPARGRWSLGSVTSIVLHVAIILLVLKPVGQQIADRTGLGNTPVTERPITLDFAPPKPTPTPRAPEPAQSAPPPPEVTAPLTPGPDQDPGSTARVTPTPEENPNAPPDAARTEATSPDPNDAPDESATPGAPSTATTPAPGTATADPALVNEAQRLFGRPSTRLGPTAGTRDSRPWETEQPQDSRGCSLPPEDSTDTSVPRGMAQVLGRIYREDNGRPLPGARLQILGTPYGTFTNAQGEYKLVFDRKLVDRCRTQAVRVTAPGYQARDVILYIGETSNGDVPLRRF